MSVSLPANGTSNMSFAIARRSEAREAANRVIRDVKREENCARTDEPSRRDEAGNGGADNGRYGFGAGSRGVRI
jgi:hypothetical protein